MTMEIEYESKPRAIICDIDGALAIRGERDPYDYSRVWEDEPNLPIVELVKTLSENWSREIIFVSGRDDSCEFETNEWIRVVLDLFDSYDDVVLHMRKTGDNRPDSIVKQEIYERHIKDRYQVDYVLDDRNQVVKMWRELGLTCLQVAEGNF